MAKWMKTLEDGERSANHKETGGKEGAFFSPPVWSPLSLPAVLPSLKMENFSSVCPHRF